MPHTPMARSFQLSPDDCQLLLREGVQYYHRYLSFWHLERYELCARDTSRNLKLFAFVREFAAKDQDRLVFDQYRPYVMMMHTKAVATPLVELREYEAAIKVIDAGIAGIRQFLEEYDQLERADRCGELTHLERWREQLTSSKPALPPPPPDCARSVESRVATGDRRGALRRSGPAARRTTAAEQFSLMKCGVAANRMA